MSKLLLLFDEFVRLHKDLVNGSEESFLQLICQVKAFKRDLRSEVGCFKRQIDDLVCENNTLLDETQYCKRQKVDLDSEVGSLNTKLKHARKQIETEMRGRKKEQRLRVKLEQQVEMVREILLKDGSNSQLPSKYKEKLAFLSTECLAEHNDNESQLQHKLSTVDESVSLLSPSNFSYDKTEEDALEELSALRNGKIRRSIPSAPPMEEKLKVDEEEKKRKKSIENLRRQLNKTHRRSQSASIVLTTSQRPSLQRVLSEKNIPGSAVSQQNTPDSGTMKRTVSRTLNKPHTFVARTVIKPECCDGCGKKMKFGKFSYRCKECRVSAHPDCRDNVPLPCITTIVTPSNLLRKEALLADYAPSEPPYIPALVILCVREIESRGLIEEGLYRVPGSDKEIKELRDKFLRGKKTPNLAQICDTNVICGCLKDFLRGLRESILTLKLWPQFVQAASITDHDEALGLAYQAVSLLPLANRDTLAFLVLHIQKIANTPSTRMNSSNLARIFGPTLVGYSSSDPEPLQVINQTQQQQAVIELLISISADYWSTFLGDVDAEDEKVLLRREMNTQYTNTPDVSHDMLGSLSTPDDVYSTPTSRFFNKTFDYSRKVSRFLPSPVV